MSKQIIVESKNGGANIDKSRRATNISNLEEDKKEWQKIVDGEESSVVFTIQSRLVKNYEYYGYAKPEDIDFNAAQILAKKYLDADPWLQINYCRDSTRQSIDEEVQTATLRKFLNNSFVNITNGEEVPFNGTIISKQDAMKQLNGKQINARSIDAVGVINGHKVKIFQKYSKVSGSGQSHQTLETQHWLEEVAKIQDKSILFVAQLDGGEAESHITELRALVNGHKNIFVGNSEQVIDWLIEATK